MPLDIQAAAYIGVSPNLFEELVKDGRMPKPTRINRPNPRGTRALRKRESPALTVVARTLTSNS